MKRKWTDIAANTLAVVVFIAIFALAAAVVTVCVWGIISLWRLMSLRPADYLPPAEPAEGVAWIMPESGEAAVWLSPVCADEAETARLLEEYTEGDSPVPAWFRPDEEMAVEWFSFVPESMGAEPHPPVGIDPGGVDWNICTTVWGWDGHGAEAWELDLLARVFYIEFWGTSLPCSEAGCDAILNLWASGNYGRTLFEALSYYDPVYGYTYEVYPWIWDWNYDPDGLAWCREFCEERFLNGPEWGAVYFQLGGYHDTDWVPPLYEMDGVFFSGASEG